MTPFSALFGAGGFDAMLSAAVVADNAFGGAPVAQNWWDRLFATGHLTATDYVLIFVAMIFAAAGGLLYYRAVLLGALKQMQPPSRVKLRAFGLGLVILGTVTAIAPAMPKGWLLLLALVGIVLAAWKGLGSLAAAALVLLVIMVALWGVA